MYKFSLDRSSKKFICPQCRKKRLVRYIDNSSGSYLSDQYGRCDRESNCGYHLRPSGNKTLIDIEKFEYKPIAPSYITKDVVLESYNNISKNNFLVFLTKYFPSDQIEEVQRKYVIGSSNYWSGATVFWQIDQNQKVRAGKIMVYDTQTGKRVKKPRPLINWIHTVYKYNDYVLQQCLFGIHNLKFHPKDKVVCIVESEKTAIIMSMLLPKYLWLATGSKSNFKEKLLKPLKKYKIVAYPDKSEYEDWKMVSDKLDILGYRIKCSDLMEIKTNVKGFDLVDLLIN
jgi:hypothetical protein